MRISPVGWAYDSIEDVLFHSKQSADVTHNHPEGIKGAQAVATAVFLARKNKSKNEIAGRYPGFSCVFPTIISVILSEK
jgi:ADP-ribosylglycohydrolase